MALLRSLLALPLAVYLVAAWIVLPLIGVASGEWIAALPLMYAGEVLWMSHRWSAKGRAGGE